MILTEAVIAHALAAIPELQLRIVRIRAAAHGTLVVIPLLLLLLMDHNHLLQNQGLLQQRLYPYPDLLRN